MEGIGRKPFQGVLNIIRFNWHFYLIAIIVLAFLFSVIFLLPDVFFIPILVFILLSLTSTLGSLIVSCYVYDFSDLYSLNWLNKLKIKTDTRLVNIHAGFDETSFYLSRKFPNSNLEVFDFYDPEKHTEISIERARKSNAEYPGTLRISTDVIPLQEKSVHFIMLILAAHEIRNMQERINFFRQLQSKVQKDGRLVVVEHLRDFPNFLAYNIGFLHFHSKKTWIETFEKAGLTIEEEIKITPFISVFILKQHGISS